MKKKNIIFFLILFFLNNCSFDNKTGIWDGKKDEDKRVADLEIDNNKIVNVEKVYSSQLTYSKEIKIEKNIVLSKAKNNISWNSPSLNTQNFLGNIYLSGIDNIFLKKSFGKNKFKTTNPSTTLLAYKNNLIFSDDVGNIFNINEYGKINWQVNIYKKLYKKLFKKLTFSIDKKNIYISDNIGFIYSLNLNTGKLLWIKNHATPLKSNIKIFNNKIFLIDQENRIICLKKKDGKKIWDLISVTPFIKSQRPLSLALSPKGDLYALNSSGDLYKINSDNGQTFWLLNTSGSALKHSTDFFESTDLVISDGNIFFSTGSVTFSHNLDLGTLNWEDNVSSIDTPIIDGKHLFLVTSNGYLVILNKNNGKILSSTNILKILKDKNRETRITGFVMGSGKIYSVTLNGYLIVSSATTGKVENFKKIGSTITLPPIIINNKLFLITNNSKIFGFS